MAIVGIVPVVRRWSKCQKKWTFWSGRSCYQASIQRLRRWTIVMSHEISQLKSIVHALPLSTADCERGFSTMNVIATKTRNSQNNEQYDVFEFGGSTSGEVRACKVSSSSFVYHARRVSSHIVNSVCWSHALGKGPTSKRPASDGGRCSGQLLVIWSADCSV